MRIVSLNAWGGRMHDALRQWIRSEAFDVLCLQEVFSAPALEEKSLEDGDGHRVRVDLFGELQAWLPGFEAFFSAGSRGYVNDSTWTDLPIEYGITTFVRGSYNVTESRSELVYGPFRQTREGRPPLSRSAQVLRVEADERQGHLVVANLHGLWEPDGKHDTDRRRLQARRFRQLISAVARPGDAVVACGDFNVLPGSVTFEELSRIGLQDQVRRFGVESTRSPVYTKSVRFADYLLVNEQAAVRSFEVPQQPVVSDHCPLIAEIDLVAPARGEAHPAEATRQKGSPSEEVCAS